MKFKLALFIALLTIGVIYGLLYHYTLMPIFDSGLVNCLTAGSVFALTTYIITIGLFEKYKKLKEINNCLEKDIVMDKFTGLFNRRALEGDMLNMSKDKTYSFIFLDIDNYRIFNNKFGHKAGDRVLQLVGEAIKSSIRATDRVYRYGGEEIVIILENCPKYKAYNIAEKIRTKISKIDVAPLPHITVSLGVANYPEDGDSICNALEASDKAMLTAKKRGKNCTVTYKCN